jgi:hypothetical protein
MTTTSTHDTASAPALPEIPAMSIATMAVGVTDLLDEAPDLPQPRHVAVYHGTQSVTLQFAPGEANIKTVARWAARFGAVLTSLTDSQDGQMAWYRAEFSYCDIAVTAYTYAPAGKTGT